MFKKSLEKTNQGLSLLAVIGVVIFPFMLSAQTCKITGISVREREGRTEIVLEATSTIKGYNIFTTSNPSRIIIDISNAEYLQDNFSLPINRGYITKLSVTTFTKNKIVRVIGGLTKKVPYQAIPQGNNLIVAIGKKKGAYQPQKTQPPPPSPKPKPKPRMRRRTKVVRQSGDVMIEEEEEVPESESTQPSNLAGKDILKSASTKEFFGIIIDYLVPQNAWKEDKIKEAVKIYPDDAGPLILLGIIYDEQNQYSKAIQCYEKALKIGKSKLCIINWDYVKFLLAKVYTFKQKNPNFYTVRELFEEINMLRMTETFLFQRGIIKKENGSVTGGKRSAVDLLLYALHQLNYQMDELEYQQKNRNMIAEKLLELMGFNALFWEIFSYENVITVLTKREARNIVKKHVNARYGQLYAEAGKSPISDACYTEGCGLSGLGLGWVLLFKGSNAWGWLPLILGGLVELIDISTLFTGGYGRVKYSDSEYTLNLKKLYQLRFGEVYK